MECKDMTCAAVHDISGGGKCSLTIALPVLSACGVETSVLPTTVLSTHTGGFGDVVSRDLTDMLLPTAEHWKSVGFKFSALYSGFLASAAQIDIIERIFDILADDNTVIAVDPVMGDGGRLYRTYTEEMADGMARLCKKADIVMPNMTEAARLLGIKYSEGPYREKAIEDILHGLCDLGAKKAVLTGVSFDSKMLGAVSYDSVSDKIAYHLLPRIEGTFHGTGDLFASALLGGILNGMTLDRACSLAVEFTHRVIKITAESFADRRYGVKFESCLPWLCAQLEEYRRSDN